MITWKQLYEDNQQLLNEVSQNGRKFPRTFAILAAVSLMLSVFTTSLATVSLALEQFWPAVWYGILAAWMWCTFLDTLRYRKESQASWNKIAQDILASRQSIMENMKLSSEGEEWKQ